MQHTQYYIQLSDKPRNICTIWVQLSRARISCNRFLLFPRHCDTQMHLQRFTRLTLLTRRCSNTRNRTSYPDDRGSHISKKLATGQDNSNSLFQRIRLVCLKNNFIYFINVHCGIFAEIGHIHRDRNYSGHSSGMRDLAHF